jgi:error-prone DNA polymerase
VASGDVHYHIPARKVLHDVLTATRFHTTVAEAGERLFPNAQRHLMPLERMAAAFAGAPEALARTIEIAEQCRFSLDELKYEYPEELAPPGKTPLEHLIDQTWAGARDRYPFGIPDRVRGLIEHELQLIAELRYEAYFLTVWDLVRFARKRGILCQGRGSAANSAVCYCLGVTSVDPSNMDVLFERFISRERNEAPDIDVDFEHERREEVLQYLYEKYGRERAGMTGVVITYRSRSAIRDAGKALGLSLDRVDALAKNAEGYVHEPRLAEHCKTVGIDPASDIGQRLIYVVNELIGFPRHLSQHVGGMVMTQGPLCELAPIENAAMEGRTVIEWDKDDLDELGILKVDVLALGMLSAIRKCFELVQRHHCRALTLANIPQDDEAVYDMICKADTMGVFQIESRAQMSMLPRLRPRCYYDLVIEVAIVRPGPIQGNMVHPYLKRRQGEPVPAYPTKEIEEVLQKTLGVPIFQEQAMRLAVVAAGFTPGEADQLRRAMAAWRRPGIIDQFQEKLMKGMKERGLSEEFAQNVFTQIRGFGEYGFPESHAASFALLVYVSAWLKHYYPAAFCASLINSQPMGFYAPAQLVRDAREHGVEVLPVDVNASEWGCTLVGKAEEGAARNLLPVGEGGRGTRPDEGVDLSSNAATTSADVDPHPSPLPQGEGAARNLLPVGEGGRGTRPDEGVDLSSNAATTSPDVDPHPSPLPQGEGAGGESAASFFPPLRLGFRLLLGFPESAANVIVAERERGGPFKSLAEFATRTKLSPALVAKLSDADAFASLGRDRRAMLWESLAQDKHDHERGLFEQLEQNDEPPVELPRLAPEENVKADYRTTGMSLKAHPLGFHRQALNKLNVTRASDLSHMRDGQHLRVAGLVILRQRPSTAKGITFVTLEDETGIVNLILKQEIWQRNYLVARRSPAWIAHGQLQTRDGVTHVLVNRLDDLSKSLGGVAVKSRDFR